MCRDTITGSTCRWFQIRNVLLLYYFFAQKCTTCTTLSRCWIVRHPAFGRRFGWNSTSKRTSNCVYTGHTVFSVLYAHNTVLAFCPTSVWGLYISIGTTLSFCNIYSVIIAWLVHVDIKFTQYIPLSSGTIKWIVRNAEDHTRFRRLEKSSGKNSGFTCYKLFLTVISFYNNKRISRIIFNCHLKSFKLALQKSREDYERN